MGLWHRHTHRRLLPHQRYVANHVVSTHEIGSRSRSQSRRQHQARGLSIIHADTPHPGLTFLGVGPRSGLESAVGIVVANTSHFLSVLVLHSLGRVLFADDKLALIGALLHIISPAGLFLSAPYAESTFSLLSFAGYLFFTKSCLLSSSRRLLTRDVQLLLSGALFGLATAFRSNGISHGVPFAWEFVQVLVSMLGRRGLSVVQSVRRLVFLGIGGLLVAAGSAVPQFVAYQRFCVGQTAEEDGLRPWCRGWVPSIYGFVQQHYW